MYVNWSKICKLRRLSYPTTWTTENHQSQIDLLYERYCVGAKKGDAFTLRQTDAKLATRWSKSCRPTFKVRRSAQEMFYKRILHHIIRRKTTQKISKLRRIAEKWATQWKIKRKMQRKRTKRQRRNNSATHSRLLCGPFVSDALVKRRRKCSFFQFW